MTEHAAFFETLPGGMHVHVSPAVPMPGMQRGRHTKVYLRNYPSPHSEKHGGYTTADGNATDDTTRMKGLAVRTPQYVVMTQPLVQAFDVQVPQGMQGGMPVQVQTPAGLVQVPSPPGLEPGATFRILSGSHGGDRAERADRAKRAVCRLQEHLPDHW